MHISDSFGKKLMSSAKHYCSCDLLVVVPGLYPAKYMHVPGADK